LVDDANLLFGKTIKYYVCAIPTHQLGDKLYLEREGGNVMLVVPLGASSQQVA
jgi:hypothetical protein